MLKISYFGSINAAGKTHRLPEKIIMFVTGLKPDLFREKIYSRRLKTLQEAMDESRAELSTYRDILEITDRVKKSDVKKEKRDLAFSHAVVKKVADTKASGGSDLSYAKKPGNMVNVDDMKNVLSLSQERSLGEKVSRSQS